LAEFAALGDSVELRCRDFAAASALARSLFGGKRRALITGRLGVLLAEADIEFTFRVRGQVVAKLGPGSRPNLWSRLLGLSPARVLPGGVWAAAMRKG